MSDFDKIIRDSMNEEEEFFPRKEMNWSRLADRLEVYEVANPLPAQAPQLKISWWRYAAAASVAVTLMASGWFYFKMKEFKNENVAIKEELKALKDNQLNADKSQTQPTVVYKTDTLVQRIYVMPKQADLQQSEVQQQGVAESNVLNNFNKTNAPKSVEKSNKPNQVPVQVQELAANTGLKKQSQQKQLAANDNLTVNNAQMIAQDKVIQNEENNTASEIAENAPTTTKDNGKADEIKTITDVNIPAVSPSVGNANTATLDNQNVAKNSVEVVEIQQIKHEFAPVKSLHTQSWADIDLEVKVTPPIVKSHNSGKIWNYLPKSIAIGVNGMVGRNTPIVTGVDALQGKGVSADLKISRRLSIGFQGDWASAEFEFRKRPLKFPISFPDTPNHPIHEKLESIDGKINTRMLGVNVQYKLTTQNWANPYVTASYNWLKTTSSRPTNFTFKDENTGGQTQRPQVPMTPEFTNNLVGVGLGLEKTFGRFTINTVVDFYKDFNKTEFASKDMVVLRGGVKFQIF